MARRKTKRRTQIKKQNKSLTLAVIGLILNIFPFPGIGSMVAGKTRAGISQFVLGMVGVILTLVYTGVGFVLTIIAFVWGIVTGINLINEGKSKPFAIPIRKVR